MPRKVGSGASVSFDDPLQVSIRWSNLWPLTYHYQQPTPGGEEDGEAQRPKSTRSRGVLRGVSEDNMMSPAQTPASIELDADAQNGSTLLVQTKHLTRQSRHGRSSANYDMKVSAPMHRVLTTRMVDLS
jgi:hypothetical protein